MNELSHLDEEGRVRMVDISNKPITARRAVAGGLVSILRSTLEAIQSRTIAKGEVFAVARVAGILAAKQTDRLIPLCHPLPLTDIAIDFSFPAASEEDRALIEIRATVKTNAQTGAEMEALTAVSIAALTIYDMCKSIDKTIRIDGIHLIEKQGGKSDPAETRRR